jgi:hypothetical protein
MLSYEVLWGGPTAKHFFDDGAHVGKLWSVSKSDLHGRPQHQVRLCSALYFGEKATIASAYQYSVR